jgi:hypothetical protein
MTTDFAANALDDAIALQKIRAYCERNIIANRTHSVLSEFEAGFLEAQLGEWQSILDILNGEDE